MKSKPANRAAKKTGLKDRMVKHLLFFSFSDPRMEEQFLANQHKDNLPYNRRWSIAGFLAYTGMFLVNYFYLSPGNVILYALPYCVALIAFFTFITMTFADVPHRVFNTATMVIMLIVTVMPMISLMAYHFPETLYIQQGSLALIISSLIFIRFNYYYIVGYAAMYLLIFELLYFCSETHSLIETLNVQLLRLIAIGIGLIVSYSIEKRERKNFVKLRIIVEERIKLSRLKGARPETKSRKH